MSVKEIKQWFNEAVREPTNKNIAVQLGVHFEEVAEMILAMEGNVPSSAYFQLEKLATALKSGDYFNVGAMANTLRSNPVIREELLDALCDQIVTATGVAHMLGMDIEGALSEVNRSNWSKFVDGKPVFNENGKIAKPLSYSPPDLTRFV